MEQYVWSIVQQHVSICIFPESLLYFSSIFGFRQHDFVFNNVLKDVDNHVGDVHGNLRDLRLIDIITLLMNCIDRLNYSINSERILCINQLGNGSGGGGRGDRAGTASHELVDECNGSTD